MGDGEWQLMNCNQLNVSSAGGRVIVFTRLEPTDCDGLFAAIFVNVLLSIIAS